MSRKLVLAVVAAATLVLGGTALPAAAWEAISCNQRSLWGSVRADKPVDLPITCDSFSGGEDFVISVVDPPEHGTIVEIAPVDDDLATHEVTYDPDDDYVGGDTFVLGITEGADSTTLEVDVELVTNDPPACERDQHLHTSVAEPSTTFSYCMDLNFQDDPLDFSVSDPPAHGNVTVTAADQSGYSGFEATYTPDAGFTGSDEYTITASDGDLSEDVTVRLHVADGPWCSPYPEYSAPAGKTGHFGALCTQPDDAPGPLLVRVIGGPDQGTATPQPYLGIDYTPFATAAGPDSFTYQAYSPAGESNVVSQTWNIIPNAAPVCDPGTLTSPTDSAANVALTCTDAEDDPVTLALARQPDHGTLSEIVDGQVTYTPDPGFVGTDRFSYTGADYARTSAPAVVRITVDDGKAPVLDLSIARGQSPRGVARHGLAYYSNNDEQITGELVATISGRTAKRLGLVRRASGPVRIAVDRSRYEYDTSVLGLLHLTDRAAEAIRPARRVPITVRFRGVDPLGNTTAVTVRRTLRR